MAASRAWARTDTTVRGSVLAPHAAPERHVHALVVLDAGIVERLEHDLEVGPETSITSTQSSGSCAGATRCVGRTAEQAVQEPSPTPVSR